MRTIPKIFRSTYNIIYIYIYNIHIIYSEVHIIITSTMLHGRALLQNFKYRYRNPDDNHSFLHF